MIAKKLMEDEQEKTEKVNRLVDRAALDSTIAQLSYPGLKQTWLDRTRSQKRERQSFTSGRRS